MRKCRVMSNERACPLSCFESLFPHLGDDVAFTIASKDVFESCFFGSGPNFVSARQTKATFMNEVLSL